MSESASESELIPPYYQKDAVGTNKFKLSELEERIGIIPPELKSNYRELEAKASRAFVKQFGTVLNPEQKGYFEGNQVLFTNPKIAAEFKDWDDGVLSVDPEDSDLGGFIYKKYFIGDVEGLSQNPRHFWAGRFAVIPLEDHELSFIESRWLISKAEFDDLPMIDHLNAARPYRYTHYVAKNIDHEKVHGIQDSRIPLPILEAAANYYQRETGKANDWNFKVNGNMSGFADLYGECVDAFGEDVHRLLFGNITDKNRRKEMLNKMKSKFTPRKIDELSMRDFIEGLPNPNIIRWEKTPTAEVRKEIESKRPKGL